MSLNGDIIRCRDCGLKIEMVRDWRDRVIAIDLPDRETPDWVRISYVEDELGHFEPVYRHDYCRPRVVEEPKPNDGRDVRPKRKAKAASPDDIVDGTYMAVEPAPAVAETKALPKPKSGQGDLFE